MSCLNTAALGDECQPLPIKSVVVGYDHEWLSVSPLALSSWVSVFLSIQERRVLCEYVLLYLQDKLLFEPYAMRKSIVYLVVIPSSITNASSLTVPLKKYFRDLSIVYKVCRSCCSSYLCPTCLSIY